MLRQGVPTPYISRRFLASTEHRENNHPSNTTSSPKTQKWPFSIPSFYSSLSSTSLSSKPPPPVPLPCRSSLQEAFCHRRSPLRSPPQPIPSFHLHHPAVAVVALRQPDTVVVAPSVASPYVETVIVGLSPAAAVHVRASSHVHVQSVVKDVFVVVH